MKWTKLTSESDIFRSKKKSKKLLILAIVAFIIISAGFAYYYFANEKIDEDTNLSASKEVIAEEEVVIPTKMKICIDPGHGGYDPGKITKEGKKEKDITLSIALMTKKILEKKGVEVVLTRDSDTVSWPSQEKMDLRTRVAISKENNAEAFVSLHCNSNDSSNLKGFEVWTKFKKDKGEELAKNIESSLKETSYTSDRGIKYREEASFAVLALNKAPSVLLELGFLSNDDDEKILTSYEGQFKCAESISDGILKYVEANYKSKE